MQTCNCPLHTPSPREYSALPTTDFKDWAVPTFECFGDADGHMCEPRWKSPDYPEPLYTVDEKKYFLDVVWPRFLWLCIILLLVTTTFAPYPRLWSMLLGAAVTLLITHYVELLK